MKKLLLLLSIIFVCNVSSQESFKYSKDGFNNTSIVTEVENMNASELYTKALNWVKETYKNPAEVLKAEIENEKIIFNGSRLNMSSYMGHGTHLRYSIELAFKDGRYKFDIKSVEFNPAGGGFQTFNLSDGSKCYNKKDELRGFYKNKVPAIELEFNTLYASLKEYILGTKKSDW